MDVISISRTVLLAAGVAATTFAYAQNQSQPMSYTYVEGGYVHTELDDIDVDGDGLGLAGSVALGDMFFLRGSYVTQDFDHNVDLNQFEIGLGGHYPLADRLDIVGSISYLDVELDFGPGNADDNGLDLRLGLRGRLTDVIEIEGGINYADLDDSGDDTSFSIDGRYYFRPELAVGAGFETSDDATSFSIGLRYEFR